MNDTTRAQKQDTKPQPKVDDKTPVHPSGTQPTKDDAESRMTSEGDVTTMDESQAGRMGEGLRGDRGGTS